MLRIWGRTNSINVQKVMWAVGELDLPHERIDAGGAFGGLDSDAYGKLNPNRRVPVIEDGETVVWESNATVRYLAARYGVGTLWAEDPAERSAADRWMDWQVTTLHPPLHPIFWGLVRTPEAKRDMAEIDAAIKAIQPLWQLLDEHLSKRSFVAGDAFSMGDIPLGCAFWRYSNLDVERPSLPNVQLWYAELKKREAYRRHVMLPLT